MIEGSRENPSWRGRIRGRGWLADRQSPTGSLRRGSIYSPFTWLPFGPGRGRLSSISSLLLNTLALLVVLDQCFSPKLLKHDELTYAR